MALYERGNAHIKGNLRIEGDLTVEGTIREETHPDEPAAGLPLDGIIISGDLTGVRTAAVRSVLNSLIRACIALGAVDETT